VLDLAQRAVRLAQRQGAEQAEAFVSENLVTTIRIAASRVAETKQVRECGIGIRVAIGQKVGFACANELAPELIERAISIARARPPNPDFKGFPEPAKSKRIKNIYDRKLAALPTGRATELAELMLQTALDFDRRVEKISGALNVVVEHCAIVNTAGIKSTDRATRIFGHLTVEARDRGRSEGPGWQGSTMLRNFNPRGVGEQAAELAVNSLNQTKVRSGEHDVILEPMAAGELLYHVFGYAVNGREVYDRTSYFADKLEQQVAVPELTLHDYGNMPGGLYSKMVDDEGVPTRKTPLIERGVLKGFVYDSHYAGKANTQSTGNGLRLSDMPGRCYALEPSPYITNLVVSPGEFKREEIIADTKRGLLLSRIWYTYPIVPQLGDFSTTSRCGFLIRRGEVVGAIKQVRIHENLPRLLKYITAIGKDIEQVMPWAASAAISTPSFRFHNVRVS
jgi:PmbA protein